MTAPRDWRLDHEAVDWQCDWEGSRRFQLLYFRSLPLAEKILAVEQMCRLARVLTTQRPFQKPPR
jgi:hypothetical protein